MFSVGLSPASGAGGYRKLHMSFGQTDAHQRLCGVGVEVVVLTSRQNTHTGMPQPKLGGRNGDDQIDVRTNLDKA